MQECNPKLVQHTRNGVEERTNRGIVCLVNAEGEVLFELGNTEQITFTRSALKLFQALPLITSGAAEAYSLTDDEIAITCGSHNAEVAHVHLVKSILNKIGVDEAVLACGAQPPSHRATRNELISQGLKPSAIHNNCSGKHAGFLALAKFIGDDLNSYLHKDSKTQQLIKTVVAEMHGLKVSHLVEGEDGCSAPNYAMSVYHQALGYKNLAVLRYDTNSLGKAINRVLNAISANPFLLAGSQRYCTELTRIFKNKIIGKTGADGIFSMIFLEQNWACTIKVEDGEMGPQYQIAQAIISKLGLGTEEQREELAKYIKTPIYNWNKHITGYSQVIEKEFDALKELSVLI